MRTLSAANARAHLAELLDEVARSDEPTLIKSRCANAVLVSEDAWRAIEETLYLVSIPRMRESILESDATPVEECSDDPHWQS